MPNLTLEQYAQTLPQKKPLESLQLLQPEVWEELVAGRDKGVPVKVMVVWLRSMKGVNVSTSGLFYALKRWDVEQQTLRSQAEVARFQAERGIHIFPYPPRLDKEKE